MQVASAMVFPCPEDGIAVVETPRPDRDTVYLLDFLPLPQKRQLVVPLPAGSGHPLDVVLGVYPDGSHYRSATGIEKIYEIGHSQNRHKKAGLRPAK
jgi:hypothetical protein